MPHLSIQTNVPKSKIPEDLPEKLIRTMSETLNKPYENCSVTIIPDAIRLWGGSTEPSAQSTLHTIGHVGPQENIKHSKALSEVISKGLGAKLDKICIWIFDVESHNVAYNGTTVQEIRKV